MALISVVISDDMFIVIEHYAYKLRHGRSKPILSDGVREALLKGMKSSEYKLYSCTWCSSKHGSPYCFKNMKTLPSTNFETIYLEFD